MSVGRNIGALSLLPPLLACLLESEKLAQIQSLSWSQGSQPGLDPHVYYSARLPGCTPPPPIRIASKGFFRVGSSVSWVWVLCLGHQGPHSPAWDLFTFHSQTTQEIGKNLEM